MNVLNKLPDVRRPQFVSPAILPAATGALIAVDEIRKSYGDVHALNGVSFAVHDGEVLGILGPNGAGKTTLIEILEGIRRADRGRATVLGCDVDTGLDSVRTRIGIAMQKTALPMNLRVSELLRLYAVLYGRTSGTDELLERLGLCEKRHAVASTLSGGQLQRLALALAVIPRPDVLFLDEPTSDLDPQGRRAVWELLRDPAWAPRCILITTHQMDEAEQLCHRVAIIDHGELLSIGRPADLIERYAPLRTVRFSLPPGVVLPDPAAEYEAVPGGANRMVRLRTDDLERDLRRLLDMQKEAGFTLGDLFVERATLEDVFITLTGRTIRD